MKRSLVGMLSVLTLALAVPAMAQSEQTASGTVVSSSATQVVIRTSDGRQMTFAVDADTNQPSTLQQGSAVSVRYHDMNGTMHAASVTPGSGSGSTSGASSTTGTSSSTTGTSGTTSTSGATGVTGSSATTGTTSGLTGTSATTGSTGSSPTGTSATGASATDRAQPTTDATGNDARMDARTNAQQDTPTASGSTANRQAADPAGTTSASQDANTDTARMPATASPLPLLGLSGLLSLAGGLGAGFLRRRK